MTSHIVFALTVATFLTAILTFALAPREHAVRFELAQNHEALLHVERIERQTYADFLFICAYTGLWGVLGAAVHPALAVAAVAGGVADVIENIGILRAIARAPRTDADARRIRIPSTIKWLLLAIVWIGLAFLPSSLVPAPAGRLSIGGLYAIAGGICLIGLARSSPGLVGAAVGPVGLALIAQVIVFWP